MLREPECGKKGVVSKVIDDYAIQLSIQILDDVAEQIVGHGAGRHGLVDLVEDRIELKDANPNGHYSVRSDVFEDDHRHIGCRVHHEAADFDFEVHQFPPTLSLFRFSG